MTGLVVGLTRMVLEFSYTPPSCGQPDGRPAVLADVHYLYFALILFALTCLIIVAVSLATAPIPKEHVRNMSYIHEHKYEHSCPSCYTASVKSCCIVVLVKEASSEL